MGQLANLEASEEGLDLEGRLGGCPQQRPGEGLPGVRLVHGPHKRDLVQRSVLTGSSVSEATNNSVRNVNIPSCILLSMLTLYHVSNYICFIVLGPERVLFFSVSDILFSGSSLKKYLYQSLLTQQSSKTRRFVNSQLYSEHHKFLLSSIQVKSDDFHEGLRLVLIWKYKSYLSH